MSIDLKKLLDQLTKLYPKYIDLSLDRMRNLLNKIDNPHLKLPPIIHIAGTNGKGSTLSYIKNILIENNYVTHFYSSPHLESIEERFIVCNKKISKKKLYNVLNYIKKINNNEKITFFEITTAAALYIFAKEKADFTLLETGLGGRLDATNVIENSLIDIISPISIDHQEFLGKDIKSITNEKLGIIKKNSTIIIGKQDNKILKFIKNKIKKKKNNKYYYDIDFKVLKKNPKNFYLKYNDEIYNFNNPRLNGDHQIENATTAISTIINLKKLGYNISKSSINIGLKKTFWPGRLEKGYLKNIPVYLDGAHNISGAKVIVNFFKNNKKNRWLIFGMINNKDLNNFLSEMKEIISGIVAIKIPFEKNCFSNNEISKSCKKLKINCVKKRNIDEANKYLINNIGPDEIIVSGSLYLVGKIRKLYI